MKIHTEYWSKPGPRRNCDWSAVYDDYEGGDGYDEPAGPIGHGATEADAVLDLIVNHPRGGIECERDRHCATCCHFGELARPFRDDPHFTETVCRHHYRRADGDSSCSDHEFDGERGQSRTLPPPVPQDDIAF